MALTADGHIWAWGLATIGELGNGSLGRSNVPVPVANLTGAVAIAAGKSQSLAVTDDGKVWAWGLTGDNHLSAVPVQVSNLNGVVAIAAGDEHNVALTSDGKVWAWGKNDSGQLGNGGVVDSSRRYNEQLEQRDCRCVWRLAQSGSDERWKSMDLGSGRRFSIGAGTHRQFGRCSIHRRGW